MRHNALLAIVLHLQFSYLIAHNNISGRLLNFMIIAIFQDDILNETTNPAEYGLCHIYDSANMATTISPMCSISFTMAGYGST
jgi:hypothetical protein